jgi:methyltransferase (TIGR00027 family)
VRVHEPSRTAAWVAALRGMSALLPREARLSEDPFGLRFSRPLARLAGVARRYPRAAWRALPHDQMLSLQIRTRVLDDVLLGFVAQGGRQVILLGAGFDCRAARFRRELAGVTVFEVDHPATQAKKRRVLAGVESARTAYLAWDFERAPMTELEGRLAAVGHDRALPTLTIWEGVTMYLTPDAIEATVAAVRGLSARGSPFAFTYFDRAAIDRPPLRLAIVGAVAARLGEPFRFGWDPQELPGWLEARGFAPLSDRTDADLARELFPPRLAATYHGGLRHIAVAERVG